MCLKLFWHKWIVELKGCKSNNQIEYFKITRSFLKSLEIIDFRKSIISTQTAFKSSILFPRFTPA